MIFATPSDYNRNIRPRVDKALGYLYFCDIKHPLGSSRTGRVWFHRHVASVALGRWVAPDEVVHHIDRDKANNKPENLKVMTAEEHSREHAGEPVILPCRWCGGLFTPEQAHVVFCGHACADMGSRRFHVDADTLRVLVWSQPVTSVAADFGVSSVAVKKRCNTLGIDTPPRGYWAKRKAAS